MAKLVFAMNVSLDGYVDHTEFAPSPALFRQFIEDAKRPVGSLYGRKIYELMQYWDADQPDWDADRAAFAAAWRAQHKWVASRGSPALGPNASLVQGDLAQAVERLKAEQEGVIAVAGTDLAKSLTALSLIDEYKLYLHPVVLGGGTPYFGAARPRLRLVSEERIDGDFLRLTYVPV